MTFLFGSLTSIAAFLSCNFQLLFTQEMGALFFSSSYAPWQIIYCSKAAAHFDNVIGTVNLSVFFVCLVIL